MTDVTLGRYYRGESIIHSLDPRVKLTGLIVYVVSLFYASSVSSLLFSFAVLLLVFLLTRVPLKYVVKGFFRMFILFLFFGILVVLLEENAIRKAVFMVFRFSFTVIASSLLTFTTRPLSIAKGIEKAFGKGIMKKPVHILSTVIMIAFRFIPILVDEAERVIDAQKSRGCSFEEKGLVRKARVFLPLLVPLFVSAFKRADELALSMDARGYNKNGSGSLYPLKYSFHDYISYFLMVIYALCVYLMEVKLWI